MQHRIPRFIPRCALPAALAAVGLASPAWASKVLYLAPNADAALGVPYSLLEFNNPLTGSEKVAEYRVLEWRDAGNPSPGMWEDWFVGGGVGVQGNPNEIWLRKLGHWAGTTTTVPSEAVSIHLVGDSNDGRAQVFVDGTLIAELDMYTASAETVLIVLRGLPLGPHTIIVEDDGVSPSQGGSADDVAILGAAALDPHRLVGNYCTANPNSSGLPGEIVATGSAFAARNELGVQAVDLPTNKFGFFVGSQTAGLSMPPNSQGNLCIGGKILRFNKPVLSSGNSGSFGRIIDLTTIPPGYGGAVQPGDVWHFQAWFRDKNPGNTSNFTDAVMITYL